MTFIAWLRANDILFLKDYGLVDTDTDLTDGKLTIEIKTTDIEEILTDFQDDGFLPEELKAEHMLKEINYRIEDLNPKSIIKSSKLPKETWGTLETPPFARRWEEESKKEEGGLWGTES